MAAITQPQQAVPQLAQARRLVVKIGSALLVGAEGQVRQDWLRALAEDGSLIGGGQEARIEVVESTGRN